MITNYHPEPSRNFVSLLLEFLDAQESRSSKKQSQFRKELAEAHQAWDDDHTGLFCPVAGMFVNPDIMTAAHVYPYFLGTTVMGMFFGEEAVGELFHVRSGLLLSKLFEKKFDKHLVVIHCSCKWSKTATGWDNRPVGEDHANDNKRFVDLHDKELVFRTSARPAARYLYFHYLIAMLRARKHHQKLYQPSRMQPTRKPIESNRPVPWGLPVHT